MTTPNTPDPFLQLQIDLHTMSLELQRCTGLKSRWSGIMHLSSNPLYLGAKEPQDVTRAEISNKIRQSSTLAECREASQLLREYLQAHSDDDDLRDEGSGLYMKLTALEQVMAVSLQSAHSQAEHVA